MTYDEIRLESMKDKRSHAHERMDVFRFDDFSVCQSDKTTIIVDTVFADIVSKRKWCEDSNGYPIIKVEGGNVRLHDFIMAMVHKSKPDGMYVDHVNRDKRDNRVRNLRFVNPAGNSVNHSLNRANKSGVTGVCIAKNGRYRAYITLRGKQVNLGYYGTLEEAKAARIEGEQRFGYKKPATVLEKCELAIMAEMEKGQYVERQNENRPD